MAVDNQRCEYMANEYGEGQAWYRGTMIGADSLSYVFLGIRKSTIYSKDCPSLMAIKSCSLHCSRLLINELNAFEKIGNSCPNVLKYFGREITGGEQTMSYNLLLEYASGGTLGEKIGKSRGGLPESEVRSYTRSILKGLEHIHRSGYAHCDLEPENIFLVANEGGRTGFTVKIGDLGFSQKVESEEREVLKRRKLDSQHCLRGTANYMAPEAVKYGVQGTRSDIWALGCVVLEMLMGKQAWQLDDKEVFDRIRMGELPTIPSEISEVAKDFIRICLERDLQDRCGADDLLKHEFVLGLENRDESGVAGKIEGADQVDNSDLDTDDKYASGSKEDTDKQTRVEAYGDDEVVNINVVDEEVDEYTDDDDEAVEAYGDDEVVDINGDDEDIDEYTDDDEVVDAHGDDEVDAYPDDDEVVDARGDDEVDAYPDDDEVVDAYEDDEEVDVYADDGEVVDAYEDAEEVDAYADDGEVVDAYEDADQEVYVSADDGEVVDPYEDAAEVDAYADDDEVVDPYVLEADVNDNDEEAPDAYVDDDDEVVDPYALEAANDEEAHDAYSDDDEEDPGAYSDDEEYI